MSFSRRLLMGAVACCAIFCLGSCVVSVENNEAVKSKLYSYTFRQYQYDSMTYYSVFIGSDRSRQELRVKHNICGKPDGAIEFHFASEKSVMLFWWTNYEGRTNHQCYLGFQETATGLVELDADRTNALLKRVADQLGVELPAGQIIYNLRYPIANVIIRRKLVAPGDVVGSFDID